MTKREFLEKLKEALGNDLNSAIVSENMNYYEQYIKDEMAKGRKEEDVIEELGDPWAIARTIADMQENQEYSDTVYTSERTSEERTDRQGRSGRVHIFGLDSWWKRLLLVLGLIGIVVLVVAVVGGIVSLLAPILLPLLLILFIIRIFNQRRY